jgi:hypothetical protein
MECAVHMGKLRNVYRMFVRKPKGKGPLVAQDRDHRWALVNPKKIF